MMTQAKIGRALLATALCALATAHGAGTALAQNEANATQILGALNPSVTGARAITLEDLGFDGGITFSGLEGYREIYFPLPQDMDIVDAEMQAHVHYARVLNSRATVKFSVDDIPRHLMELKENQETVGLSFPFNPSDTESFAKLTMAYSGAITDKHCYDKRLDPSFVTLLPSSNMTLRYDPASVRHLRTAWIMLPKHVTITLGNGALSEGQYQVALMLATRLRAMGRKVHFNRLPRVGDSMLVRPGANADDPAYVAQALTALHTPGGIGVEQRAIASNEELGAWLLATNLGQGEAARTNYARIGDIIVADPNEIRRARDAVAALASRMTVANVQAAATLDPVFRGDFLEVVQPDDSGANVRLLRVGTRPVIAVTGTQGIAPGSFIGAPWIDMAAVNATNVAVAVPEAAIPPQADHLYFSQLVGDTGIRQIDVQDVWSFKLSMRDMPAGKVPVGLDLDVLPGYDHGELPNLIHVSVNDVMLRSFQLPQDGTPKRLRVEFPKGLIGMDNDVSIMWQRKPIEGDCIYPQQRYPAQILPSSEVLLGNLSKGDVTEFYQLPPLLKSGLSVYLPNAFLDRSAETLPFMTELLAGLAPKYESLELHFEDAGGNFSPDKPFIVVGNSVGGIKVPVRFDQGKVTISTEDGDVLLDVSRLGDSVAAQMIEAGGNKGIWLRPVEGSVFPRAAPIGFNRGNVSFVDETGVSMAFETGKRSTLEVTYPEERNWSDTLKHYKNWLFFAFWILVTLLFVYVLRRTYPSHTETGRRTDDN